MGRAYVTDVLAFDMRDDLVCDSCDIEGDVIISTDAVIQNSRKYKTSLARELSLYVIHGILHLLDYDDHKPSDIKKMRAKEHEILERLGSKVEKVIS